MKIWNAKTFQSHIYPYISYGFGVFLRFKLIKSRTFGLIRAGIGGMAC